jgi:integrase/recombinase XerD
MKTESSFPYMLQAFFTERLVAQRHASVHTIASYRDTFCLLFQFAKDRLKKAPTALTLDDLDAPFIGAFLDHLERDRGNSPRSRNVRLAAIHSFFKYVALHEPGRSAIIQRVLAMPTKRYDQRPAQYLTQLEVEALLGTPDLRTWAGRRDRALLLVAVQTGLRVSELVALRRQDVVLDTAAHVRCIGKGRKERCTPLRRDCVIALRMWLRECLGSPAAVVFPNRTGGQLSRDGVSYILAKHVAAACQHCPSLLRKRVTPHVLRHTAAMDLLQHGVDRFVIALWLGHESVQTTQMYVHADMRLKQQALTKTTAGVTRPGRYKPGDRLLAFLKGL